MKLQKRFPDLDPAVMDLYMTARQKGVQRDFFPEEYHVLENVSMSWVKGVHLDREWIQRWISKWPSPSITGLTYSVSGNTAACIRNMKRFIRDFNGTFNLQYELEEIEKVIDEATDLYLEEKEYDGWEFTKKNAKFILDSNGSVLETYIRQVLNQ